MNTTDDALHWSSRFGLAISPLFEREVAAGSGSHSVLLDGANGSFALSVSGEELWRDEAPANWVWSSGLPHHITVTASKVAVLRWDTPTEVRVFERASVERNLTRFYSFLVNDRLRSNRDVVSHLLSFFRRLRSLGHASGIPDVRTTDLFTTLLARLIIGNDQSLSPSEFGLADDAEDLLGHLNQYGLQAVIEEIEQGSDALSSLRLHPSLAVRHAGGQLFQEAHFELLKGATDFDLFGLVGTSKVAATSRGGAHFTPPTLARSVIERAFESLREPLSNRKELIVCDPACGSGAFLHEALRALRRAGYEGRLQLTGRDVSQAAIAMARFILAASLRDWAPKGGVYVDLKVGNSLDEHAMPAADVIVMNPPFIAFAAQNQIQRDQLSRALGSSTAGRGDYSMAFVVRALEVLKCGGALGTLFPASLLASKAASHWRERLLDLADLRLLASIGDFGLFSHALVQVAAAVFSKGHAPDSELLALITNNDPQATSAALREVRRQGNHALRTSVAEDDAWSLFPVPQIALHGRPTWRLPTPKAEAVLRTLSQAGLPTVGDIFDIAQGIQTGLNKVLLLTEEQLNRLPRRERRFFRPATMTDSIQNGRVVKSYWLFFPHDNDGPLFSDEVAVQKAVPRYFAEFLEPNRSQLQRRASLVRSRRTDWWGLMHPREWSVLRRPRIITKFFGAEGAFLGDYDAHYFAVMGHVWTFKEGGCSTTNDLYLVDEDSMDGQLSEQELLAAYVGFCNSEAFIKLLGLYAPHVAGGQYDLSSRHVSPIPVPDLQLLSMNPETGRIVHELIGLGRVVDVGDPEWRRQVMKATEFLYGGIDFDAI